MSSYKFSLRRSVIFQKDRLYDAVLEFKSLYFMKTSETPVILLSKYMA